MSVRTSKTWTDLFEPSLLKASSKSLKRLFMVLPAGKKKKGRGGGAGLQSRSERRRGRVKNKSCWGGGGGRWDLKRIK
jgi:hypothetical protein